MHLEAPVQISKSNPERISIRWNWALFTPLCNCEHVKKVVARAEIARWGMGTFAVLVISLNVCEVGKFRVLHMSRWPYCALVTGLWDQCHWKLPLSEGSAKCWGHSEEQNIQSSQRVLAAMKFSTPQKSYKVAVKAETGKVACWQRAGFGTLPQFHPSCTPSYQLPRYLVKYPGVHCKILECSHLSEEPKSERKEPVSRTWIKPLGICSEFSGPRSHLPRNLWRFE